MHLGQDAISLAVWAKIVTRCLPTETSSISQPDRPTGKTCVVMCVPVPQVQIAPRNRALKDFNRFFKRSARKVRESQKCGGRAR